MKERKVRVSGHGRDSVEITEAEARRALDEFSKQQIPKHGQRFSWGRSEYIRPSASVEYYLNTRLNKGPVFYGIHLIFGTDAAFTGDETVILIGQEV